jgi:hypothetical protein
MTPVLNPRFPTREAYLIAATEQLANRVFKHFATVPPVRVSVGFPGGGSARKRIGEHWHPESSSDGISQIFISPVLGDAYKALDVLTHELVHACTPGKGHGAPFSQLGKMIGLEGKPTRMSAGPALGESLKRLIDELGTYPHAELRLSDRKKQTTRLLKVSCPCGYMARVTRTHIENLGAPLCPCEYDGPGEYRRMDVEGMDEQEEGE